MTHIFIEGTDAVGKSTLTKSLSKILNLDIIRMQKAVKGFKNDTIEDMSYIFSTTIAQLKNYDFIVDRGFVSSLVYSKIYKRKYNFEYINDVNKSLKPIIIILTSDIGTIIRRRKVDKIITNSKRNEIIKEYENVYKKLKSKNYNVHLIDTTNLNKKEVLDKSIEILKKHGDNIYFYATL
jgi:thymidylate kinase